MKSRHAFSALTLAILSVAAMSASAQSSTPYQEPGFFYGGVSAGEARAKVDEPGVANSLLGANGPASGFSSDEKDTGYKLFGGYQFNRNIALEGGYFDLGKTQLLVQHRQRRVQQQHPPPRPEPRPGRHAADHRALLGAGPRGRCLWAAPRATFTGAGAAAAGVTTSKDSETDVKVRSGRSVRTEPLDVDAR